MINIKAYLLNVLVLPMIVVIILATILMGFWLNPKTLTIVSHLFGIASFLLLVVVVGTILAYNPPANRENRLVKGKAKISSWVEPYRQLKWLQGDRAIQFSLLYIGITTGLCSLGLQLWLAIIG